MKKTLILASVVLLAVLNGFDIEPSYYSQYKPIFMQRSELEKSIKIESPRKIQNPGKIYIKDNLIFISEQYCGIHVIDNANPENPVKKAFIQIDGCVDLAMKDQILYADNAVDLVSLRLKADLSGIEVTSRVKNVFPELRAPDGYGLSGKENAARPQDAILVKWVKR